MRNAIGKLTPGVLGGAMLLLVGACAAATRGGAATERDFTEEVVLRGANANANMLHAKLLYLDKDDYKGLRELIDLELDGELIAICAMMKEPSFGSSHSRAVGRTILARIATYRSQRPAADSMYQLDGVGKADLQSCLAEALAGKDSGQSGM